MAMSASSMRSPRPTSVASYQSSSPRLPSPLNPSPNSFSSPLPAGHTPRNSPVSEMSDTLSPLRERLDTVLTSPRSPPGVAQPLTSYFSRSPHSDTSPELSPVVGSIPLQTHRVCARHPSPSSSPFAQGIPFPSSSPRPSSPLAGPSQSPIFHSPRPLSPASNDSRQGSPALIYASRSQFHARTLCSLPHLTHSHSHLPQSSPIQIIQSTSSRFPRTQSLVQQSFGSQHTPQIASSSPDDARNRRVLLCAESPHSSTCRSPIPVGQLSIQDMSTVVKGDSTPLNEAPIRWWGGRRGWLDDWDNVMQHPQRACDSCTSRFSGGSELDDAIEMAHVQLEYGNPLSFREPFARGGSGSNAFLDEEIRASFDGVGGVNVGSPDPSVSGLVHASTGVNVGYEMEGIPVRRAIPVPMAHGITRPRIRDSGSLCNGVEVGSPSFEERFVMQKTPDDLMRSHPGNLHGSASGFIPDATVSVEGLELGHGGYGHEPVGHSRRFSNASTRSSTSYVSCISGPSQSQSQSHMNTCPSLYSLGIGIEEVEREERRSKTLWRRRNSGSTLKRQSKDLGRSTGGHSEDVSKGSPSSHLVRKEVKGVHGLEGECVGKEDAAAACSNAHSKQPTTHKHEKDVARHGSFFARVVSRHEDVSDEHAQRVGYSRAENCVSLAITAILPAATIARLSPVGQALVRMRESASFVGHEIAPVIKDTLTVSANLLSFTPFPGLEEAAKALLSVWDACQKVDTNRLSCLRLAERCATLLYSVRCDIEETGVQAGLVEPVERLCDALSQIRTFLDTQLHRPFLKRYVRREEIARELQACNDAITDAASRFGLSVQIRTYREVCLAAVESKRFAQEAQALLSLDHQIIQRQFAMFCEQQVQTRREEVMTQLGENVLGLTMDGAPVSANPRLGMGIGEGGSDDCGGDYLMPPPAYGPPQQLPPTMVDSMSTMRILTPNGFVSASGCNTPTYSKLESGYPSDVTDPAVSAPSTPTPTKVTFVVEETKTRTETRKMETTATHPASPIVIRAIKEVHQAQDSVDAAVDEASLQGTLAEALEAHNDVEMVRRLQVARGEIPEAAETLRRMLGVEMGINGDKSIALDQGKHGEDRRNTELDRKFMQNGIEAMMRLSGESWGKGEKGESREGTGPVDASKLPSWTITRYEVIRTRKIGRGFFSDVYLGHWRKFTVVIKVLAHCVSRDTFVRHVELWNTLDHPHVLPLYGASSAVGEKPWFLVSKFCSGDNLAASLKRARVVGKMVVGDKATVRVDLLRFMHEIAKGMAYLHGCGITHGDLRAANVLVDENGQCVLSDFGQCEIKSEAHRSCGQPEQRPNRWRAPEMLMGDRRPTNAADVYAFAVCCVEILGMGDHPWATLDDKAIRELVMDKDERPPIPMLDGYGNIADVVTNLVQSCWIREPACRPLFSSISATLEELWTLHGHGSPQIRRASPLLDNHRSARVTSTESSPADEQYETASESMRTEVEEETIDDMIDVSLTSPVPALTNGHSVFHVSTSNRAEVAEVLSHMTSVIPECRDNDKPASSSTNKLHVEKRNEEYYRLIVGSNHVFHNSLTLPLWTPTHIELGAVGYLSKPKGEFVTLFNAIDPFQSSDERLRQLPSMYGYGKFEVQKREEAKRSVAQRGLDAISGFLTFKTRGDRSHPERIARQYAFPLVQGKPSAHLCVEKTVYRYMDHLEVPLMWFKQHADLILEVCTPRHAIQREDLILVVGTLDAPDWAVFVSDDHADGRAQFNVFASREKGEPWGMYSVEMVAKNGDAGLVRCMSQGTFTSKVSCAGGGGHDVAGDTVMLAGLQFEQGMQALAAV